MRRTSIGTHALSFLLHQKGGHDAALRRASVPSVIDDTVAACAALAWTQFAWWFAILSTGWWALVSFVALDFGLFTLRLWLRRRLAASDWGDGTIWAALAANLVGSVCVASQVVVLCLAPGINSTLLAVILAVGGSGYVASVLAAFPVFATIELVVYAIGLGFGLFLTGDIDVRMIALLTPYVAAAYWTLTLRTHDVLLAALRSQIAERLAARHDAVTCLPNRLHLREELSAVIGRLGEAGRPRVVAVLAIDLDGFKLVNDRYGHAVGDQMLLHVAKALRTVVRPGDLVARIGGDEYVVVLPGADEKLARSIGGRIVETVSQPMRISTEQTATVGASVGCFVVGGSSISFDDAVAKADGALYEAKRAGKGRVTVYGDNVRSFPTMAASG